MIMKNKIIIKQSLTTLLMFICLFLAHQRSIDDSAELYTEQGLSRTLVTFAVSRSLNGVISVVQGTEVAVSPAGIGLNFAPGQILDPINDLIERFSWVVLASGTSIGIQRLLLEITSSAGVTWLLSGLIGLAAVFIWLPAAVKENYQSAVSIISKVLLILVFLRFTVPVIAITNEAIYLNFTEQKYQQAQIQLESSANTLQNINDASSGKVVDNQAPNQEDSSLLEKAEQWFNGSEDTFDFDAQLDELKVEADAISHQVINMIVVFVLQTILLPLFFLWLMIRLAKAGVSQFKL